MDAPELAARPPARDRDRLPPRSAPQRRAATARSRPRRGGGALLAAGGPGQGQGGGGAEGGRAGPARRVAGRVPPPRGETDVVADVRPPRGDGRGAVR